MSPITPEPRLYADRFQPCGCRGVPPGQHLPGCRFNETLPAARCTECGLRTATIKRDGGFFCGQCGARR